MDILDRLFSRELNRRTGARAIKIDAEQKTARAVSGKPDPKVNRTPRGGSFLCNLNMRFPWLKIVAAFALGAIVILDLLDFTISKVHDPVAQIRRAPMSKHVKATERVLAGKKLVALTFDDGPSNITTPRLLDVLAKRDVLATFFMLGNMARGNSDLVRRVEKEGHEVASHTMYHQNLINISAAATAADINEAKAVFNDILGHLPKYTRPPYGNINNAVRSNADTPLILWSVDTLDWKNHNPAEILEITKRQVYDGGIILMHDVYETTVDAVAALIDELRQEGYEFATISELAEQRSLELSNGAAYRSL